MKTLKKFSGLFIFILLLILGISSLDEEFDIFLILSLIVIGISIIAILIKIIKDSTK